MPTVIKLSVYFAPPVTLSHASLRITITPTPVFGISTPPSVHLALTALPNNIPIIAKTREDIYTFITYYAYYFT
jgi:hypothetical protein